MLSTLRRHKFLAIALAISSSYIFNCANAQGQEDTTQGQPPATRSPANKTSGWGGYLMLGGLMMPDYIGSSDYQFGPLAAGKLSYDRYYIELKGPEGRFNVSPIEGLDFGPVMGLRSGRGDVSNNRVDAMRNIDSSFELGGFAKASLTDLFTAHDKLAFEVEALTDVTKSSQGTTVTFGPSYEFSPLDHLHLGFGLAAAYASDGYQNTYFGIDAGDARRSGLSVYRAGGGMQDIGLSITADYQFDRHWGLIGVAKYSRLLGDAADSPIVKDKGNRSQFLLGTGIVYRY